MKKLNVAVMSLLATAAFTFNSCSTDDALTPGSGTSKQEASYLMSLSLKSSDKSVVSNAKGTRTAQQTDKENGTADESTITNGTIYLYDGGTCVFSKDLGTSDWEANAAPNAIGTTKPIKVSINSVSTNKEYQVYFVANSSKATIPAPMVTNLQLTASTIGGADYARPSQFVMFNQNDETRQANHSSVIFTEASKDVDHKVTAGDIYLDRVVARVDAPTVNDHIIKNKEGVTTTKNINVIESVTYDGYTLTNMANKSYLMQNWTESDNVWSLNIPGQMSYYKPNSYYGTKWLGNHLEDFTNNDVNYIFENTTSSEADATGMYYKFTVKLTEEANANADFTDGTFYRYNHKIYTSLQAIMDDPEEPWPFTDTEGNEIKVEDAVKMIKGEVEGVTLASVREKYHINVYEAGAVYYKYNINDKFYAPTGYYSILRNSVYKLTVNNIWDLGKDVPNGPNPDDEKYNYWMDVTVTVNPWVLNTIDVDLK